MRPKLSALLCCFMLLFSYVSLAQSRTITGHISDQNNSPVQNASVVEKTSNLGTVSDENGNFSITVPSNSTILVVSHASMETLEVPITGDRLSIQLKNRSEEHTSELQSRENLVCRL